MTLDDLKDGDALVVVDVQNDFCPGGSLAVDNGDAVVPVLNRWMEAAAARAIPIWASRDWHPPDHCSFKDQGGPWPPHCIQDTEGAAFHPDLRLPDDVRVVDKGTDPDKEAYSAFDGTQLGDRLRERGVGRVFVGGLATDYCVKATVLDALKEGFRTCVIRPAVRAVNVEDGDGERALEDMREAGAVMVEDRSA